MFLETFESSNGSLNGLGLLREGESELQPPVSGPMEEAGPGNTPHTDMFDEILRELSVVLEACSFDVCPDVVGSFRLVALKARIFQRVQQQVSALIILVS